MNELEALQKELASVQQIGDRNAEYLLQGELGNIFFLQGKFYLAIQAYKKALEISEEIGDLREESATISNLGNAYAESGDINEAIESYQKALALAQQIGDKQLEGKALNNLGLVFYKLKDYDRSITYYKDGLAIAEEIVDKEIKRDIDANMSLILNKQGEINSAVDKARRSRLYLSAVTTTLIFLAILGLILFWILSITGLIPAEGTIVTSTIAGITTILGGLLSIFQTFSLRKSRSRVSSLTETQPEKSAQQSKSLK